jgi:hypothetical protein
MPEVKHCFAYRVKHYLIPRGSSGADNKEMLDGKELARLLREAMDTAKPRVSSARLAEACNVTPQAVNGWRKTGRMAKRHITTAANLTGKSIEYFLGADAGISPASTPQQELLLHLFGELMPLQRQELVKGLRALLYANKAPHSTPFKKRRSRLSAASGQIRKPSRLGNGVGERTKVMLDT